MRETAQVFCLLFYFVYLQSGLQQVIVDDLRTQIRAMIDAEPIENGEDPVKRTMLAGLVRLSFHDCVGQRCDGCINNKHPENAGTFHGKIAIHPLKLHSHFTDQLWIKAYGFLTYKNDVNLLTVLKLKIEYESNHRPAYQRSEANLKFPLTNRKTEKIENRKADNNKYTCVQSVDLFRKDSTVPQPVPVPPFALKCLQQASQIKVKY